MRRCGISRMRLQIQTSQTRTVMCWRQSMTMFHQLCQYMHHHQHSAAVFHKWFIPYMCHHHHYAMIVQGITRNISRKKSSSLHHPQCLWASVFEIVPLDVVIHLTIVLRGTSIVSVQLVVLVTSLWHQNERLRGARHQHTSILLLCGHRSVFHACNHYFRSMLEGAKIMGHHYTLMTYTISGP